MRNDKFSHIITLKGFQFFSPENSDSITLKTVGSYRITSTEKIIEFIKYDNETETKNIISINNDNEITHTKISNNISQLKLIKGQRQESHYVTEYGNIMIGTFANRILVNLDEKGGEVLAEYDIDINSISTGKNKIHIIVQEAKKHVQNSK